MPRISCMGGWCAKRAGCRHHITDDRSHPVERLCEVGMNDCFIPIEVGRRVGIWDLNQVDAFLSPALPVH